MNESLPCISKIKILLILVNQVRNSKGKSSESLGPSAQLPPSGMVALIPRTALLWVLTLHESTKKLKPGNPKNKKDGSS
jgi:hypothetical protein